MRIRLLVPSIAGLPTGGNIYNDRLAHALGDQASVEHVLPRASDPGRGGDDVWLVDSLLLSDVVESVRRANQTAILVGLIHYLHLIDPRFMWGEKAREERRVLALLDGFVATSTFSAHALAAAGVSPERILVAEPGLDPSFRIRTNRRSTAGPVEILTVASLVSDKGLSDVGQALAGLSTPNWRWTLVGTNRLEETYAGNLLADLQTTVGSGRFRYLGALPQKDLAEQYRSADLFVLCSRFETCGMVVREAMAAGNAVVAYRVGGLPEQIRSHREGLLVDAGVVEHVTAAMESLIYDARLRGDMGNAAATRAAAFPNWAETADRVLHFLIGLASHPPD